MLRLENILYFGTVFGNYYLLDGPWLELSGLQKYQELFILVFKKVKSTLFSVGSWFTIFEIKNVSKFLIYFIEHHIL